MKKTKFNKMKKIALSTGIILFISTIIYTNDRYGLLSMAGLNGKGLAAKEVRGDLKLSPNSSGIKIDHSEWSTLLHNYVEDNGLVDYKGFFKEKGKLENYLNALSNQVPTDKWPVQEQLAYYINLYNAHTVHLILENYPVKSIKDINGAWTKDFVQIGEKELSLGALEHSILRKMNEPRIHFAINCASGSCPKLLNEAFIGDKLDDQLNTVTRAFINSENNSISNDNLELSKIFKWYKGDFMDGDLITYINQYADVKIAPKAQIHYKEYDWSLNGSW